MRMNANDLINELHRCLLVTDSGDIGLTTKLEGKLFLSIGTLCLILVPTLCRNVWSDRPSISSQEIQNLEPWVQLFPVAIIFGGD